jgi:hypothetical protein
VNISRPPADREHAFGDHSDINQKEDDAHAHEKGNGRALPSILPPNLPPAADIGIPDVLESTRAVRSRGRLSSPAVIRAAQPSSTPMTSAPAEVLAFPSTRAQIAAHEQLSATLPKHYPRPSLLMLALSKQWAATCRSQRARTCRRLLFAHVLCIGGTRV